MHQCLTFVLSRPDTDFSDTYDHDHVNTMSVLERDVNFLSMFRSELLKMPSGTQTDRDKYYPNPTTARDCGLTKLVWELDGTEVYSEKFKSHLARKSLDTYVPW